MMCHGPGYVEPKPLGDSTPGWFHEELRQLRGAADDCLPPDIVSDVRGWLWRVMLLVSGRCGLGAEAGVDHGDAEGAEKPDV